MNKITKIINIRLEELKLRLQKLYPNLEFILEFNDEINDSLCVMQKDGNVLKLIDEYGVIDHKLFGLSLGGCSIIINDFSEVDDNIKICTKMVDSALNQDLLYIKPTGGDLKMLCLDWSSTVKFESFMDDDKRVNCTIFKKYKGNSYNNIIKDISKEYRIESNEFVDNKFKLSLIPYYEQIKFNESHLEWYIKKMNSNINLTNGLLSFKDENLKLEWSKFKRGIPVRVYDCQNDQIRKIANLLKISYVTYSNGDRIDTEIRCKPFSLLLFKGSYND